jgi:hypothetical protein
MEITFGIYSGKFLELVILKYPGYVNWMLNQKNATGPLGELNLNIIWKTPQKTLTWTGEGKPTIPGLITSLQAGNGWCLN